MVHGPQEAQYRICISCPLYVFIQNLFRSSFGWYVIVVKSCNMHRVPILLGVLTCVLRPARVKRHKGDTGVNMHYTVLRREGGGLVKQIICGEIWSYKHSQFWQHPLCNKSLNFLELSSLTMPLKGHSFLSSYLKFHICIAWAIFRGNSLAGSLLFLHFLGKPVKKNLFESHPRRWSAFMTWRVVMLDLWHFKVNVPCLPYFYFLLKFTVIETLWQFIGNSHLLFDSPIG